MGTYRNDSFETSPISVGIVTVSESKISLQTKGK